MKSNILYSKNTNNKIQQWSYEVCELVDKKAQLSIISGNIGCKLINRFRIIKEGKNIGKRNETTPYEQALKEAKSKYKFKLKQGFKEVENISLLNNIDKIKTLSKTLSVNKTDNNDRLKPMKCVKFRKGLMNYPCVLQPKINGVRNTALLVENKDNDLFNDFKKTCKLLSKEGHEYLLPNITNYLPNNLFINNIVFDGELYVHNEILSNIRKRLPLLHNGILNKASRNSSSVQFYIFDLSISNTSQIDRLKYKNELLKNNSNILRYIPKLNKFVVIGNLNTPLVNVEEIFINSDEEAIKFLHIALNSGFEGVVIRDFDAEYMFGSRKTNISKLKLKVNNEFKIIDIIEKNKDNVRIYITFVLQNDINDKTFEATPIGNEKDRLEYLNNKEKYIGSYASVEYYERTINNLPFHANAITIRPVCDLDINDTFKETL